MDDIQRSEHVRVILRRPEELATGHLFWIDQKVPAGLRTSVPAYGDSLVVTRRRGVKAIKNGSSAHPGIASLMPPA